MNGSQGVNYPSFGNTQATGRTKMRGQKLPQIGNVDIDFNQTSTVAVLERLVEALEKNQKALDSNFLIPTLERQSTFDATGTATEIGVHTHTSNIFLIRFVAAFIPDGGAGLLVLDDVQLPLPAGVTAIPWYQAVSPDSVRQLQSTVAGTMALVLMGEQLSRKMMFR